MLRLYDLVRRVILGSTLLIASGESKASLVPDKTEDPGEHKIVGQVDPTKGAGFVPRLIFNKYSTARDWLIAGHRSHRSHSSHSSHYSSRTGTPTEVQKPPQKKEAQKKEPELVQKAELGSRTLSRGMIGPDVVQLRAILKKMGYDVKSEGEYDEKLETTVQDFQQKMNITPSGIVDPITTVYLKNSPEGLEVMSGGPKPSIEKTEAIKEDFALGARLLSMGMRGKDVEELEELLQSHGYGNIQKDGVFDELLEIAVKDFQTKMRVPSDGRVGPLTVYYLRQAANK